MRQLDVVYILGSGSRWDNNEIRYSLRSLKNISYRRVYVIGESLPWFQNIEHIPADDLYVNKQKNAIRKLEIACLTSEISEDFILMNDDFYILDQIDHLPVFYRWTLLDMMHHFKVFKKDIPRGSSDTWMIEEAILNTYERYPDGLDYSLHVPIVFNKYKLYETILSTKRQPFLLRSLYGNDHNIGGTQLDDVKVHRLIGTPTGSFISSHDTIRHDAHFQEFLRERFSEPSIHETPPTV